MGRSRASLWPSWSLNAVTMVRMLLPAASGAALCVDLLRGRRMHLSPPLHQGRTAGIVIVIVTHRAVYTFEHEMFPIRAVDNPQPIQHLHKMRESSQLMAQPAWCI